MLHVFRRGDVYQWRRRVPLGLRSRFGRNEIVRTLRTQERHKAVLVARRMTTTSDRLFEMIESDENLSAAQIATLARDWFDKALAEDEAAFAAARPGQPLYGQPAGKDEQPLDADLRVLRDLQAEQQEELSDNDLSRVSMIADEVLSSTGLALERNSDTYRRLCRVLMRANLEVLRQATARRQGDYTQPIRDPLFAPGQAAATLPRDPKLDSLRLSVVAEAYKAAKISDGKWKPVTQKNEVIKLDLFVETMQDKPIDLVSRDDIRGWRDSLFAKGYANSYIIQHFKIVSALFTWAKIEGKASIDDPTKKLRPAADDTKREAFGPEDLKAFFGSAMYHGHYRRDVRNVPGRFLVRDHKYWLPLIALHSGLRVEEIAKLKIQDIRPVDGIECFHVADTKTAAGTRIVPVHPRLETLGFLKYRNGLSGGPEAQLWPDLAPSSDGYFSPRFCVWFPGFLELIGVRREGLVFHSFRHSFISSLERAGVPETLAAQLAGHEVKKGITYGTYGGKLLSAKDRLDLIKDLDFGVDLSGLRVD